MQEMRIKGKKLAISWQDQIQDELARLSRTPRLLIVNIGDDPGSKIYIDKKVKAASRVGIDTEVLHFEGNIKTDFVAQKIKRGATNFDGVIVQLPLPSTIDREVILNSVPVGKDVDGLSADSFSRLEKNEPSYLPATVRGIIWMIRSEGLAIKQLKVAIVGAGILVGYPLLLALRNQGAQVGSIDKETAEPWLLTRKAQVLVSAAGVPGLITKKFVATGQLVIDAGFTIVGGKPKGDVDTLEVEPIVSKIAAVPGGVGPITVSALLANVLDAANNHKLAE